MSAEQIAAGLTKAEQRIIFAASVKPKSWRAIRRDAKIHRDYALPRVALLSRLFEQVSAYSWRIRLNETGLEVRRILQETPDD